MTFNEAKQILNQNNEHPYSDKELKEIIDLIQVLADVACDTLLKPIDL